MKAALFLFFIFLFSIPIITVNKTYAKTSIAQQVQITAYVDEHLTYYKNSSKLIISTNLSSNFIILSGSNSQKFYITGPAEKTFPQMSSFILVAEF